MPVQELGHVVLYVRDLDRSVHFYEEVLGWKRLPTPPGLPLAAFSSGRTHHELLLIEVGPHAAPIPAGRRVGLYHFGLKVGTTDEELRQMLARLRKNRVEIVGTADHGVTHSLYIRDPDGSEIELYIDVQPERWQDNPEALFSPPRPLQLERSAGGG